MLFNFNYGSPIITNRNTTLVDNIMMDLNSIKQIQSNLYFELKLMLSTSFLTAAVSYIYNYNKNNGGYDSKDSPTDDLIIYINKNINNSDLLRAKNICKVFGFSESYFGRFFKASNGLKFQNYTIPKKIKMIKIRLNFSDMLMSEIAEEFQFSDSNHLNKFCRKVVGVNLNVYKSQVSIKTLK